MLASQQPVLSLYVSQVAHQAQACSSLELKLMK